MTEPASSACPPRQVLVTRPEPGLGETLRAVAGLGFAPVACPVLRIVPLGHRLPGPAGIDAIVLTSRQALPALAAAAAADPAWRSVRLYGVGAHTTADARALGFQEVVSADADADALARLVAASEPRPGTLLLPGGCGQGRPLAALLEAQGFAVHRVAVYAQQAVDRLADPALDALRSGRVEACLFFSGASTRGFVELCPAPMRGALAGVRACAISRQAALPLAAADWRAIEIAERPDAASLLALLQDPKQDLRRMP